MRGFASALPVILFFSLPEIKRTVMDTIKDTEGTSGAEASLLPYFQPGTAVGLRLRLRTAGTAAAGKRPLAFSIAGRSGLATLYQADITAGAQLAVTPLLLAVQSDLYGEAESDISGFTNIDIERQWIAALERAVSDPGRQWPLVLPEQRSVDGDWRPFKPLFYCAQRGLYCHPLCPHCGNALMLCRDDDLLRQRGLPAYSTSNRRFLFCADCREQDPVFYEKARRNAKRTDIHDPATLVESFGQLIGREDLAGALPCVGCPEAITCYGPENRVAQRMQAVRFYPFYMMLQPAPDLRAADFLALLSGADIDEIPGDQAAATGALPLGAGRQTGLLFDGDSRRFAEVFYLKLTFLQDLLAIAASRPDVLTRQADLLSLDGIWVHLGNRMGRLPVLWNFSLELIDNVGMPEPPLADDNRQENQVRRFMGSVWFYTLLVNQKQSFSQVAPALVPFLRKPDVVPPDRAGSVFAAKNIFWLPDGQAPPDACWEPLWQRALSLGAVFFQRTADEKKGKEDSDIETIDQRMTALRYEIRQALFSAPATATASPASPQVDEAGNDQDIRDILQTLLDKWPQDEPDVDRDALKTLAAQPETDGDIEETIILTDQAPVQQPEEPASGKEETQRLFVPPPAPPPPPKRGQELDKTVLIHSTPKKEPDEAGLEKTVVMRSPFTKNEDARAGEFGRPAKAPAADAGGDEDLEKTVILKQQPRRQKDAEKTVTIKPMQAGADDIGLEETVMIGGSKKTADAEREKKEKRIHPGSDDDDRSDDLDATIVITPKKPER